MRAQRGSCYSDTLISIPQALFLTDAAVLCVVKQRLNGGLPLSAEELENVFETLDSDGNGFLTLHEFSSGFSMSLRRFCFRHGRLRL